MILWLLLLWCQFEVKSLDLMSLFETDLVIIKKTCSPFIIIIVKYVNLYYLAQVSEGLQKTRTPYGAV